MIEVLKQALEALEKSQSALAEELSAWDIDPPLHHVQESHDLCGPAITSLRQAIAELESQEPVVGTKTWFEDGKVINQNLTASEIYKKPDEEEYLSKAYRLANELQCHLATAPTPQRSESSGKPSAWVGLTKDEVDSWNLPDHPTVFEFAQFIEAKLKEKNT